MLHETLLIIQCFFDERLKVQSHLPLFCKFSRANSSHFNRNLHHWEFHVRAKEVLTQITVLILRKDSFSFCSHVSSSWYTFISKRDIRIIYIQNKQIINKKKMRDVTLYWCWEERILTDLVSTNWNSHLTFKWVRFCRQFGSMSPSFVSYIRHSSATSNMEVSLSRPAKNTFRLFHYI